MGKKKRRVSTRTDSETSEEIELKDMQSKCCSLNQYSLSNKPSNYGSAVTTEQIKLSMEETAYKRRSVVSIATYRNQHLDQRISIHEVPGCVDSPYGDFSNLEHEDDCASRCSDCEREMLEDIKNKAAAVDNVRVTNDISVLKDNNLQLTRARRLFRNFLKSMKSLKSIKTIKVTIERPLRTERQYMTMISYVRSEASDYASQLRDALEGIKVSTYLDTGNLLPGCDWQNHLNKSVELCIAFIPLITPSYGETLWTSREFKLADCLSKLIIPINFCKNWPPPSLAIQLSTIQYIGCTPRQLSGRRLEASPYSFHKVPQLNVHLIPEDNHFLNNSYWPCQYINEAANQIKLSIAEKFRLSEQNFIDNLTNPSVEQYGPPKRISIETNNLMHMDFHRASAFASVSCPNSAELVTPSVLPSSSMNVETAGSDSVSPSSAESKATRPFKYSREDLKPKKRTKQQLDNVVKIFRKVKTSWT